MCVRVCSYVCRYGAFLYIYAVSGLAGALVQVTLMAGYTGDTHIGACGAGAAILGVLGSLAAHYVTNGCVSKVWTCMHAFSRLPHFAF